MSGLLMSSFMLADPQLHYIHPSITSYSMYCFAFCQLPCPAELEDNSQIARRNLLTLPKYDRHFFPQLHPREDPFPRGLSCHKDQRQGPQDTCPSLLQSPEGWEGSKSHSKELSWQWTQQMDQAVLQQPLVAGRPTAVKGRGRQSTGWSWHFLWGGREQRLFKIIFPAPLADSWGSPHCLASGLLYFHLFQGLLSSNWGSNAECSWAQEEGTYEPLLSPESNIYLCWHQVSFKNWNSFESGDNKGLFSFIKLSTFSVKGNFTLFFVRMRGRFFLCQDLFLQHGSPLQTVKNKSVGRNTSHLWLYHVTDQAQKFLLTQILSLESHPQLFQGNNCPPSWHKQSLN